jgi:nucleoside-diphosphate-sugar epimerase
MRRVLVTGGSGFIGTNLVDALLERGDTVLNLDRAKPVKNGHDKYWKSIDILDAKGLEREALEFDPQVVVHLAAVTDLDGTTDDYYNANVEGTRHVIDFCAKLKSLQKVLFTSSMYVCQPGYIPKNYDDYKPHTLYGQSKVRGEKLVKDIRGANYSWVIIRPTSIWGPWFNVPYIDFFNVVYQGKYFDFGNTCTKTYGFVDNTVFQILKLIEADNVHGKTFYLGDTPPIQISEWANEISIELGKGPIKKVPFFAVEMAALAGDILSKLKIKFPMTSFRLRNMTTNNILPLNDLYTLIGPPPVSRLDGVRKTIAWLQEQKGYTIRRK